MHSWLGGNLTLGSPSCFPMAHETGVTQQILASFLHLGFLTKEMDSSTKDIRLLGKKGPSSLTQIRAEINQAAQSADGSLCPPALGDGAPLMPKQLHQTGTVLTRVEFP